MTAANGTTQGTNQPRPPIWPTLKIASSIADWANIALILSLVVGVVSTALIVWMGNVKEQYWDRSRDDSERTIAELNKETARLGTESDRAKVLIAEANARAAEATKKANEADLARLKLEAELAPRTISPKAQKRIADKLRTLGSLTVHIWVFPSGTPADAAPLANQIKSILVQAGWKAWISASLSGQTVPGFLVSDKKDSKSRFAATELVLSLRELGNINAVLVDEYEKTPNFGNASTEAPSDIEPTIIIRIGAKA